MKKILLAICVVLVMSFCSVSYASVDVPETVRIKLNDNSIIELDLDEYLYGVVTSEMGTSYRSNGKTKQVGIEALKAQAVSARTYAVYKIMHSGSEDYDLTATTSDQVYKAVNASDIVKEAVDSTSGQVITYDGEVISTYFFSTSGGHTEAPENVWYSSLPYLEGVEDPYEPFIEGKSEWEARISANKYGKIEILEINENGRVQRLKVGDEVLTKNTIRTKLGANLIKSTWFELEFDEDTNEYVFYGKGYGHGVGMSQHGAMGMAEAGFNYQEILKWYYQDIELEPNGDQYIIIDDEDFLNENDKKEESNSKNDVNKENNSYDGFATIINGNQNSNKNKTEKVKEYGPMLKSILAIIEDISSWR